MYTIFAVKFRYIISAITILLAFSISYAQPPNYEHTQNTGIEIIDASLKVITEVGVPVTALGACFWFIFYLHRSNKSQIEEILEAKDQAVQSFMEKDSKSDERLLSIIEKGNALTSDAFLGMKMALSENTKTMDSLINEIRIRRT